MFLASINSIAQGDVQIKFDAPASHFTQSLCMGNGRLGAMIFGGTNQERIVLNEISMWSGGVEDPNRHDAHQYLPTIQHLLIEEKNKEAQALLQKHFTAAGKGSGNGNGANVKFGCYQVLADLFINWQDTTGQVTDYNRILELDKALGTTTWKRNEVSYKQEVFVSAPQQVVMIRLSTSKERSLSFDMALNREENAAFISASNSMTMNGQLNGGNGDDGIEFAAYAKAIADDGHITAMNNGLQVRNATECIIIISAATDLNWPQVEIRGPDPLPVAKKFVQEAEKISWLQLKKNHVDDYTSYFERCRFNLFSVKNEEADKMITADRLVKYAAGNPDTQLPVLYFNFGRYLLISGSRPGGLPANLQGLWAEEYQTPWNGDYHLNINLQMNYWPAEKTNLADCHQPLLEFTKQLVEPGRKTAKAYYNTEGWTAHMMSNPWKFTAPGESATWGSSLTGGAWLCQHLWQHYLYNPDKNYLRNIYPILKGATRFYTGILITDPKTGWLVTAPSNSPENTYITANGFEGQTTLGPTMDMQIGRELLNNTIAAASILQIEKSFRDSLQKIKEALAPNQISKRTGGIQEWLRDYKEAEPKHRHVSHLYGLYPFNEINKMEAPALLEAAEKSLLLRGDEGTGWSRAWKIAFWARVGNGDHALKVLNGLLKPAFTYKMEYGMKGAGTYPNLFCAHPPFQVDGNLGATAAIAEMLLQSNGKNNVIQFLPALPSTDGWKDGNVKGICAPNGFELNFEWSDGEMKNAEILSKNGYDCFVQLPAGMNIYNEKGRKIKLQKMEKDIVLFKTKKNRTYYMR